MTTGNTAAGIQGATAIAGLLGTALSGIRNEKELKKQARGQETEAMRALRSRLAAQNQQSAMRVANSQPGVNPALAQRNAQQALAQAQVGTNADLARLGVQQQQQAQQQLAGQRQQRIQGAVSAATGLANSLGASMSVQAAQQEKQALLDQQKTGLADKTVGKDMFQPVLDPTVKDNQMLGQQLPLPAQPAARPLGAPPPVADTAGVEVSRQGGEPTTEDIQALNPALELSPENKDQALAQSQAAQVGQAPLPLSPPPTLADAQARVNQIVEQDFVNGNKAGLGLIADFRDQAEAAGDLELSEQLRIMAQDLARRQEIIDTLSPVLQNLQPKAQ